MDRFTISCTEEQAKLAYKLGAPIKTYVYEERTCHLPKMRCTDGTERAFICPTAEQMIGWLRSRGVKFLLSDEPDEDGDFWFVGINEEEQTSGSDKENKELAAIDAALEYLSNAKSV